jgi:hypothetical protein
MISHEAEYWMFIPFVILLYGFIKLCMYIVNEQNKK